jgi:hypothetical protein
MEGRRVAGFRVGHLRKETCDSNRWHGEAVVGMEVELEKLGG